jgi:hypothetical protein
MPEHGERTQKKKETFTCRPMAVPAIGLYRFDRR